MKKSPSRKEIEAALSESFIKTITEMNMEEDAATLCRTFRAVLNIGFKIMAAGDAPEVVVLGQLDQVLRKNLGKRKPRTFPAGALGGVVLKPGKA